MNYKDVQLVGTAVRGGGLRWAMRFDDQVCKVLTAS